MKTFRKDPLRILLAIFSGFGMLRSLLALLEAVTTEPARTRAAGLYFLILIAIVVGAYLLLQPWPSRSTKSPDTQEEAVNSATLSATEQTVGTRLVGAILLTLASSLLLNTWLMPHLSLARPGPTPTATLISSASETPLATPTRVASDTPQPPTPTIIPTSTLIRTATPTPVPTGIRMQVVLPRVHIRLEPTSHSPSLGELNNGDWLYFDGRTLDAEGTLWLRIGPDQVDPGLQRFSGNWVFAGGLGDVGLNDLPFLPATATPAG